MFTGLIQGLGRIEAVENRGAETRLRIAMSMGPQYGSDPVRLGESIAVNGVCLTVETWSGAAFTAYASAETMKRTNLGRLKPGSRVNLERALAFGDRLGGHLVSGHVDCIAEVDSVSPAGESKKYVLRFPAEHGPLVVEKGSVALDGISLTINDCGPDFLSVNIIPETQRQTTILDWSPGRAVNLETDLIGKYVQRMVAPYAAGQADKTKPSGIDEDFLRRHGF